GHVAAEAIHGLRGFMAASSTLRRATGAGSGGGTQYQGPRTPRGPFFWFFSQLRERRTADRAELLVSRQQTGVGRGRRGLYVPAGWLGGVWGRKLAARAPRRATLAGRGAGGAGGGAARLLRVWDGWVA